MSICWLHLFLAIISHQRAGDGLRMIVSLTMIMMASVMLQGGGGDDYHVETGGQMLDGIAGWGQMASPALDLKSKWPSCCSAHVCTLQYIAYMLDCTLCIIHCYIQK